MRPDEPMPAVIAEAALVIQRAAADLALAEEPSRFRVALEAETSGD